MKPLLNLLTLLVLCVLGGCDALPEKKTWAVHDFGFPASTPINEATLPAHVTVEAPEWLADTRIRYRLLYSTPSQIRFYALDRWLAPPPELIEDVFNNSGNQWSRTVTVQLHGFEQQFDAPGQAKALLRFTATANSPGKTPQSKQFFIEKPCQTADAKGAVSAFAGLAQQAVIGVRAWLGQLD